MFINGLKIFFGVPILLTPFAQGLSIITGFIGLAGIWLIFSGTQGLITRFVPKETAPKPADQQIRP